MGSSFTKKKYPQKSRKSFTDASLQSEQPPLATTTKSFSKSPGSIQHHERNEKPRCKDTTTSRDAISSDEKSALPDNNGPSDSASKSSSTVAVAVPCSGHHRTINSPGGVSPSGSDSKTASPLGSSSPPGDDDNDDDIQDDLRIKDTETSGDGKSIKSDNQIKTNTQTADLAVPQIASENLKTAEDGPARTPQFIANIPSSITYNGDVEIGTTGCCLWRTPQPDWIMLGGKQSPTVCVVDKDFNITTHTFTLGNAVESGVCISMEKSIVRVYHSKSSSFSVHTCDIDVSLRKPSKVDSRGVFKVTEPVDVFRLGKNIYGIYCKKPDRIEKFKLRDILIEKTIQPTETMTLERYNTSHSDRACVTPDSQIFVTSWDGGYIDVFSEEGQLLCHIGQGRGAYARALPGRLLEPASVQCGKDGRLMVTSVTGDIHVYDGKEWVCMMDASDGMATWSCVATDTLVWTAHDNILAVHNINNIRQLKQKHSRSGSF